MGKAAAHYNPFHRSLRSDPYGRPSAVVTRRHQRVADGRLSPASATNRCRRRVQALGRDDKARAGYIPPLHITTPFSWLRNEKTPLLRGFFVCALLKLPALSKIRAPLMIVVLRLCDIDP